MHGSRIVNTAYQVKVLEDIECTHVCPKELDSDGEISIFYPQQNSGVILLDAITFKSVVKLSGYNICAGVNRFMQLIERDYDVHLILDNLPVARKYTSADNSMVSKGF